MPNVLLIMSDEHNPFVSSVHGHQAVRTPNMERLAGRGTVYENTYCPSPLCMPSRSAFMSGRRVHEIQCYSNCNAEVDPSVRSYGAALADQGVHTAYIGKTDVYAPGETLGFSEMMMPGDRRTPGDTNHRRTPLSIREGSAERANGYGPREENHHDEHCVDRAIEWLRSRPLELDQPWVLTVNVTNPHFPHRPPPDLWDIYEGEGDLPDHGSECDSANHPYARDLRDHFETDQFNEEQIRGLRRGYLGCVSYVDRQLGRLLDALCACGFEDETDVIYTSDHGEMLGKFGMWWKCTLYEDSVRVPCIAAGPSFSHAQNVTTPVNLLDVQAAIFATTGAERPTDWTGEPLQAIRAHDADRPVFSEYHGHGTRASAYMIRRGPWKYLHYVDAPHQLFHLAEDPDELNNLYEEQKSVAGEMESALREICSPEEESCRAERFIEQQLEAI